MPSRPLTASALASSHTWPHFERLQQAMQKDGSGGLVGAKERASLAFTEAQIANPGDFPTLSKGWSDFAGETLDTALQEAWQSPRIRKLTRGAPETGTVPGLFVLGLGKLGGRDLNYSSDVDLVAFFDADTLPVPPHEGRTYVCDMVLKAMTKSIAGKSDADRIWRVDWRLRPDPSVTGVSMATDAALEFFAFRSAPWRRLAMMKARVVAGDREAGEAFLQRLGAFVWRQTLDFRTIDEIAAMKDRIKNEHPGLAATGPAATDVSLADQFHIKLGSGGIREIEFIVNAQQLIWGGRQRELRTTNTVDALAQCANLGHVPAADAGQLRDAYIWLRRLENAVQMIGDRQTHTIPDHAEDRALITAIMGAASWKALTADLEHHRRCVADRFAIFLEDEQAPARPAPKPLPVPSDISPASEAIVETWLGGFLAHGATPDQHLQGLDTALLEAAADTQAPDDAIAAIDSFLRALPRGGQYLRLLASHTDLAQRIFSAFLKSAPTASLMQQSPHVVDVLLERAGSTQLRLANDDELLDQLNAQPGEEARLEWLRSWTNERLFLLYLAVLGGERNETTAATELAMIAERALQLSTRVTCMHTGIDASPISTVAFGRLGMADMHPLSDLDLMFLTEGDDADALDRANRFSLRLKSTLDMRMKAGRVWEIDTRLRPSGRSGPPTLRPISFRTHQLERAKTWEHIALVPARFVCGSDASRTMFDATRREVLTTPRDLDQLAVDTASMLALLRAERISDRPDDPYEVKLVTGGLMEAEFLLHSLVLHHGATNPQLADLPYNELAAALARIDGDVKCLAGALTTLANLQFRSRLHGASPLSGQYKTASWQGQRDEARSVILKLIEQKLPKLKQSPQPEEAVRWLEL